MRTALITGASRGLGRALAMGLTGAGWDVVVDARDAAALASAGLGERAVTVAGDVTDPGYRARLAAADELGGSTCS